MGKLRNLKHEIFAKEVAVGTAPVVAYEVAGFRPHRANHFRLMRRPEVASRIGELKQEREDAARAARVSAYQVLAELNRRGIVRVTDFFDRDAVGALIVCDLQTVPVEVSIALLRFLREALGVTTGSP
jgi:phage terminase small subunit